MNMTADEQAIAEIHQMRSRLDELESRLGRTLRVVKYSHGEGYKLMRGTDMLAYAEPSRYHQSRWQVGLQCGGSFHVMASNPKDEAHVALINLSRMYEHGRNVAAKGEATTHN